MISPHPEIHAVPIPLATTAACEVIPPRTVKIPFAALIPSISSGDVSRRTKITLSPLFSASFASSAVKYTFPAAAPGDAGNAFPSTFPAFRAATSNVGCNN